MHPYSHHKQNAVGKRRANKLVHGNEYARGGKVKHDDEAQDRKLIKQMIKQEEKKEGRASGGKIQDRILPGTYADRGAKLPIFPINPLPPPAANDKEKK